MKLTQIESALRPNFIWDNNPGRRLQTHYLKEGTPEIGLIIFIGVADSHGFNKKEITDYLDIKSDEYNKKLNLFKSYMLDASRRQSLGKLEKDSDKLDLVHKTWYKTKLVVNYIRLNFLEPAQRKQYFNLLEMGF